MPPQRRKRSHELDKDYEEVSEESEDTSEDEGFEELGERDEQQNLQSLDDDELFGVLKKLACKAFRQMLSTGIGASIAENVGNTRIRSTPRVSGTNGARVQKKIVKTTGIGTSIAENVGKTRICSTPRVSGTSGARVQKKIVKTTGIGASIAKNVGNTRIRGTPRVSGTSGGRVQKKIVTTRQNVSYFAEIVEKLKLNTRKCKVIEDYGFGSLLSFDKCTIPLPFSCWIADHIQVKSSDIVVKNKSIPISVQTVQDVLGIPIGGRRIEESDSDKGKKEFLGALKLTRLPNFKTFGDKLLKDDITNDELVRCFLIVALCTFLCPNSNTIPSPKYLLPLVDVKSAGEWDWSELVYSWLMKKVRRYQQLRAESLHARTTLGGCLYLIDVVYLDFLMVGPHRQLPSTLPRISVWKQNMIKEFSVLDCVQGHIFGKRPILPFKSTCYAQKAGQKTPSPVCNTPFKSTCYARKAGQKTPSPVCNTDVSDFQKELLHRVPGTLSPVTLDDITALYTKHAAAAPSEMPFGSAKSIMVDVIQYFYQRSQRDQPDGDIPSMNNGETSGSRPFANIDEDDNNISTRKNIATETGQRSDYDNDNAMPDVQSPIDVAQEVSCSTPLEGIIGTKEGLPVDKDRSCDPIQPRDGCESFVSPPASGLNNSVLEDVESHANIVPPQPKEDVAMSSGDTKLVPSSAGGTQPIHVSSSAETEKVPSTSPYAPDLIDSPQGCSPAKKRKVCDDLSFSSHESRHLQPPSVNSTHKMFHAVAPSSSGTTMPKSMLTVAEKITMWDIPPPSVSLGPDFLDNDDNHVHANCITSGTSHKPNLEEKTSAPDSAERQSSSSAYQFLSDMEPASYHSNKAQSAQVEARDVLSSDDDDDVQQVNVVDVAREGGGTSSREASPEPVPIVAIDRHGTVLINNSSEVVITGFTNFSSSCDKMAKEAND